MLYQPICMQWRYKVDWMVKEERKKDVKDRGFDPSANKTNILTNYHLHACFNFEVWIQALTANVVYLLYDVNC